MAEAQATSSNEQNSKSSHLDGAGDSVRTVPDEKSSHVEGNTSSAKNDDSEWETMEELSDESADEAKSRRTTRKNTRHSKTKKQKQQRDASILQLKITLKYYSPPIWRRILVSSRDTFEELHYFIQGAMGWRTYHMHDFSGIHKTKGRKMRIVSGDMDDGPFCFVDMMFQMPSSNSVKETRVRLDDFLRKPGDKVEYMYDFGDGWTHDVVVEEVLPYDKNAIFPKCVAGERACPPEDCGGVSGYQHLLEVRANPQHEQYEELITDWLEDYYPGFDPDKFEPNRLGIFF